VKTPSGTLATRAQRTGAYWPSDEQELLLRAALLPGAAALEAWRALRPRLDPGRLDHASRQLLPLLGGTLHRHGIEDPLTADFAEAHRSTESRNRTLFDAGRRLLLALLDAGIDTLVLKGGALVAGYYRDLGLRPMRDLDVVVPTARAEAAIEILRRVGWAPKTATITPAFIRMQHAHPFADDRGHQCDLHWHIYWECCDPRADDELWAASVPLEFEGVPTRMLGPADQLLHLCVHGSRRARRPGLLWVPDALAILRAGGIDWSRLVAQAARRRFALRARTMLGYLRTALAAPVADDALARLEALPVSRLERLEYRIGNRRQGLLGELPSYWCNYRRLRAGGGTGPALAFVRYLQQIWELESIGEVARGALVRARKRVRAAVLGPAADAPRR
jgi:hypothetical protein